MWTIIEIIKWPIVISIEIISIINEDINED